MYFGFFLKKINMKFEFLMLLLCNFWKEGENPSEIHRILECTLQSADCVKFKRIQQQQETIEYFALVMDIFIKSTFKSKSISNRCWLTKFSKLIRNHKLMEYKYVADLLPKTFASIPSKIWISIRNSWICQLGCFCISESKANHAWFERKRKRNTKDLKMTEDIYTTHLR